MEIAGKTVSSVIDPFVLTFYRFAFGAFFLLPFFIFNRGNREKLSTLSLKSFLKIISLGFINTFLSMGLLQIAVHKGSASIAAIIISSNSLFVYIFSKFMNKSSFSIMQFIKIGFGILGITGVLAFSYMNSMTFSMLSFVLALAASMLFAIYTINGKELVKEYGNMFVTFLSFLFGSLFYIPVIFIFEKPFLASFSLSSVLTVLYLGFAVTGLGYALFFEGLKGVKAEQGSMIFFLKPAIAVTLSQIILKEQFNIYQAASVILIFYAIFPSGVFNKKKTMK